MQIILIELRRTPHKHTHTHHNQDHPHHQHHQENRRGTNLEEKKGEKEQEKARGGYDENILCMKILMYKIDKIHLYEVIKNK